MALKQGGILLRPQPVTMAENLGFYGLIQKTTLFTPFSCIMYRYNKQGILKDLFKLGFPLNQNVL